MRTRLLAGAAASSLLLAMLAGIPAAHGATTRYASPTGSGTECTEAAPCTLAEAVTNAGDGDTVQLTADEYVLTSVLDIGANDLTIQGPMSVTDSSSFLAYLLFSGIPDTDSKIRIFGNNVHFQRLAISGTTGGSAALVGAGPGYGTTYDRVRIRNTGESDTVVGDQVTMTNSVVTHDNPSNTGSAVAFSGTITGSTIYSRNGTAVLMDNAYEATPYCDLSITNTLAWGGSANMEVDDTAGFGSACSTLSVDYDYSWIPRNSSATLGGGIVVIGSSSPVEGAHTLPDLPAIFDPTGTYLSDLVLPVDSPAVNAGCTGAGCSTHDYYGRSRPIGSANDVGAMEQSLAPETSAVTASGVTTSQATLTGEVTPNGTATSYSLQFRRVGDAAWQTTATGTIADDLFAAHPVLGTVNGLAADATYQTQLTATNDRGTAAVTVSQFVTAASPASARLTIHRMKAKVSRRTVSVKTSATPSATGRLRQYATTGSGMNKRVRCRTAATITAPARTSLTCSLGKKGRNELRRKKLALRVTTQLRPTSGSVVTRTTRLTIRRKR